MSLWRKFLRAEYQCQPGQLFRRGWRILNLVPSRDRAVIRLPWGLPISLKPRESIGRSIVALNTLDLPVTEAIWRLLDDRATCADIGANIGYMTSVMAARLCEGGTIHSFEPMPELADALTDNVVAWHRYTHAHIQVHRMAVAEKHGPRSFHLPPGFEGNNGLGMLGDSSRGHPQVSGGREFTVNCGRLDQILAQAPQIDLVKVDVEGCERQVFEGAETLLRKGRIRDIVFEEYDAALTATSLRIVRDHGYEIFLVARSRQGPVLLPVDARAPDEFDPPTYLATKDPHRAQQRFAPRGWSVFRTARLGPKKPPIP